MDKQTLLAVLLGILLLVSVAQTAQLASLDSKLKSEVFQKPVAAAAAQVSAPASSSQSIPITPASDLPNMVGGC